MRYILTIGMTVAVISAGFYIDRALSRGAPYERAQFTPTSSLETLWPAKLDTREYDERLLRLAAYNPTYHAASGTDSLASSSLPHYSPNANVVILSRPWPAYAPYPHGGAILPFKRIVAYYGNFFSKQMGILGEYSEDEVLARLASTSRVWADADPETPVIPAIHYIATVAQHLAGADGMYRMNMPDQEIEKAYAMAKRAGGLLFLDLQVGKSTLEHELPRLRKYLVRPDVHLAIDPEFSMKDGNRPGITIGSFDDADINYAIAWLSSIVREEHLPPKVLVVHRFTESMIKHSDRIQPTAETQVVINMDGWGSKTLKRNTYQAVITSEPVQFAGIKLFYKNDLKPPSSGLLTPKEVLELIPRPIYVQYQ